MCGRPMLDHLVRRLDQVGSLSDIMIATSDDPSDDPLESYANAMGIGCCRGPLDDVAKRFAMAMDFAGAAAAIRINGDSPMLDPALLRMAIGMFRTNDADLVTNVWPERTYPKGQSVEILRRTALQKVLDRSDDAADREHVTRYIYRMPSEFGLMSFNAIEDYSGLQLSVDTETDFRTIEALMARLGSEADTAPWNRQVECLRGVRVPDLITSPDH